VSKRGRTLAYWVYGGSIVFHAGLALVTVAMPTPHTSQATAITLVEAKKKAEPPKPPPPPPPPPKAEDKPKPRPAAQAQPQQAKTVQEAKPEALPPVPMDNAGFADLGMSLGNSDGPGLAVPAAVAAPGAKAVPAGPVTTAHKVQQLEAPTQGAAACNEPVVKPKRKVPVAPKYTMEARQAEIEGVVRVQVTVDESGHVIAARVVGGLGYGLDESALAAAKATTFEPATQCGKAVVGTTILPFRFEQT
jgi:periplasmic protein TonB